MSEDMSYEISSGNIFADLGLPDAEEHLAKAELVSCIAEVLRQRNLTQAASAKLLGIDQPKISRMLRGQFTNFSTERLMHFLTLLGRDIEIVVSESSQERVQGTLRVSA